MSGSLYQTRLEYIAELFTEADVTKPFAQEGVAHMPLPRQQELVTEYPKLTAEERGMVAFMFTEALGEPLEHTLAYMDIIFKKLSSLQPAWWQDWKDKGVQG